MKKILIMDAKNYDENLPEIRRVAVRGIIVKDGKLLMIENDFGEVKLPGGGQDEGETDRDTLLREVQEETGFQVLPESVVEFGEIEEKRMSLNEPMIWHQINRLFFCEITGEQGACDFSENEKKYGFRQVWYTLEEALEKNRSMLNAEGENAWNQREYRTLLLIKEHLERITGVYRRTQ